MGTPLRVLCIEDSEDDFYLVTRELVRAGYDIITERVDRPDAMTAALKSKPWDLVLADYSMPNFGGDAALALLRKRELDIPFIFVSGTIGEEAAVAAMRVGANDYIIKGNLNRLIPAIEREINEVEIRRKRRQAEQALRESDARYRELVENATYGIYRSSMEARFIEFNPALSQILGYSGRNELLALDIACDVYRNRQQYEQVIGEARKTGLFRGLEVGWKRSDGRSIVVRLSGRVLHDKADGSQTLEVIAEDVTERRALEKQVSSLQKFDAIGRLAGGIAHDFNNVIGAILGWAELGLEEVPADSNSKRYLEKVLQHGRLAAGLTRQLLAFSRNQPFYPSTVDLNHAVSNAIELLGPSIGAHFKIATRLASGLASVLGDPTQIQQVLMNLCLNARDAMPAGGQLVLETSNVDVDPEFARAYPGAKPGEYVLLTVADDGVGMDAETLENIFEPFFTTKEVGKGTGLGLATVYGVVQQHGGFVHVESELNCGTTFKVYWPGAQRQAQQRPQVSLTAARGGNETILLADDHEGIRTFAQETLESLGYTVLAAKDGEEAVHLFRKNAPEIALLILDITMPELTGPEAYKKMSSIHPNVPVIFITGYSRETASLRSLADQGLTVVQKPFTNSTLTEQVRLLLDSRQKSARSAVWAS